ncbi:acyltransferase family protein [Actinoplanes subglobosus]|uniref:Acyltransferase family protein n=1 Tax=Actinoplanes subglobosus TaxID=1547892 RepID=A0ABV8IZC5_9ACTN
MTTPTTVPLPAVEITTRRLTPPPAPLRRFRPDVQGLRAVAVLLVLLYHADVPGFGGGYVGVDVFFVISGYLITGNLLGEITRRRRIAFAEFYVRRARRLLLPAAIVAVTTLVAAAVVLPPLRVRSLTWDAILTAVYGLNVRLAIDGVDYQNATDPPSPLQHFWSLAVEEQFYLVWPLLIAAVVLAGRRYWRAWLCVAVAGATVASLVVSQILVRDDAPLAYFSLQSRAWELGLGALVAVGRRQCASLPRPVREVSVVAGLAAIVAAGLVYDDSTAFPGWNALLPVLGTAAVIVGGSGVPTLGERLLTPRPMQWAGTLSYPWYLWHWPPMIIVPALAGHDLGWPAKVALSAGALGLALLTHLAVERPVARARVSRAGWIAIAALLTATVCVTALLVRLRADVELGVLTADDRANRPAALFAPDSAADPFTGATSGPVEPGVLDAVRDTPRHPAECIVDLKDTSSPPCLVDPSGNPTTAAPDRDRIVLIGDSHAGQWYPAVQAVAASHGWSTEILTKAGCPLPELTVNNSALKRRYSECDTWRTNTLARLAEEPAPRMVFVSALNWYAQGPELIAGWRATLSRLAAPGVPLVYLTDTPTPTVDVPACLSGSLPDWDECAFSRTDGLRADPLGRPDTATSLGLAAVVEVNSYLCPGTGRQCPAVRGGVTLYRDASHLTDTAMTLLTPAIRHQLKAAGLPG